MFAWFLWSLSCLNHQRSNPLAILIGASTSI